MMSVRPTPGSPLPLYQVFGKHYERQKTENVFCRLENAACPKG